MLRALWHIIAIRPLQPCDNIYVLTGTSLKLAKDFLVLAEYESEVKELAGMQGILSEHHRVAGMQGILSEHHRVYHGLHSTLVGWLVGWFLFHFAHSNGMTAKAML